MVGTLPPPMGGDAKALKTLVESAEFIEQFTADVVDISDGRLRSAGGPVITVSKVHRIVNAAWSIASSGRGEPPALYYLVIAQSPMGAMRDLFLLWVMRAAAGRGAQVILHLHGGGFQEFYRRAPGLLRHMIRRSFGRVRAAIVLGPSLAGMFDGILPRERVAVVANCVSNDALLSVDDYEAKMRSVSSRPLRVLYLSNMIVSKGYLDLLEAAGYLASSGVELQVSFAGPFPTIAAERAFIDRLATGGAAGVASYKGAVSGREKYQLLREHDVFVLPTYFPNEGQPISILEAMGAGMAIICTDHGGIADLVTDGVNGVFVPREDPHALAQALGGLAADMERVRCFGAANRQKVLNGYTEDAYVARMSEVVWACLS